MRNIRQTLQALRAWFRANFMYCLIVPEYKGIHYTFTYRGMLEWADQYPGECVYIFTSPVTRMRGMPKCVTL